MSRILLEEPFLLGVVLIPILLVVVGYWNVTRSLTSRRILQTTLVLIPVLFIVQTAVITQREQLQETVRQLATYVEAGDIPAIMQMVSPRALIDGTQDRTEFEQWVQVKLQKYDIRNPSISVVKLELKGPQAELTTTGNCTVVTSEWTHFIPSKWRICWEREVDRWLITDLQPLEIAGSPMHSLHDIP